MGLVGTWPLVPAFVIIVGGVTALAVSGAWLVQRRIQPDLLLEHNDVNGFVLAVVGVVYAVLLGFVAVGVWGRFDRADDRTYDEAGNLTEIYRDADFFPRRAWLRSELRTYTETIISGDWPAMREGRQNTQTRIQIERIAATVRRLPVRTLAQSNVQYQMLGAFQIALSDRDARMSLDATGLHPVMWIVLAAGGIIAIGFTYLFGFRFARMRSVTVGALAAMIALVLFLTQSLNYPFRGGVQVTPEAFEHALQTYSLIDRM
jgi:hypothetical protein